MEKIRLENVTLIGIDCVNIEQLVAVSEICTKFIEFGAVKLLSSQPSECPYVLKIPPITRIEDYGPFVIKELYKYIDTEYMLTIQNDGFILNPFAWSDDFLMYDYIGAPWWYNDEFNVGNGGFSLRSKRLMERVALDPHIEVCHPEDNAICRIYGGYLREKGFKFPSDDEAYRFSVEKEVWDGQFGFHGADIRGWDIYKYADRERHAKYIDLFFDLCSKTEAKEKSRI